MSLQSRSCLSLLFATALVGCTRDATEPHPTGPIAFSIVSGSGQSGVVGTELGQPLIVLATDSTGASVPQVTVNFVVTSGGGSVYAAAVSTDESGRAADYWTLGTSTTSPQRLEVRSVSAAGEKQVFGVFTATPLPGPPTKIVSLAGNNQRVPAGTALPILPAVALTDQYGNRTPGVSVTYTIYQGGGSVSPNPAITDSSGVARTSWTVGLGPNTMNAAITGTTQQTTFSATGCDCWSQMTAMPTLRWGVGVAAIDDILYAVGGGNNNWPGYFAVNEAYDPGSNTWTTRAPMHAPRQRLGVVALNGRLYAVGGDSGVGVTFLPTVEAYDPTSNTWTTLAPMPTARDGLGVASLNGLVYAAGGYLGGVGRLATVEVYDPATDSWTAVAPMPTARDGVGLAALNGHLYAVGGSSASGYVTTVDVFDPSTNTWTAGQAMPTARGSAAVTVLNGILYVIGGRNASGVLTSVVAFDPSTGAWTTKPELLTGRYMLGAGSANQTLFAVGGALGNALTTVESLRP